MRFLPTPIAGALLIEPEPRTDERGFFARVFCKREFAAAGVQFDVLQSNLARSASAGQIRGLHYQEAPVVENKVVRCVAGAVLDVIVDMRKDSPSYRKVYWTRLDDQNCNALYVPTGVAHGYQVLRDHTDFMYLTDQYYTGASEKGVRFSDPSLGIPWPLPPTGVTERDSAWPLLA